MARFAVGAVFGIVVGVMGGAACGIRAQEASEEAASPDWVDRTLDCVSWYESRGSSTAYNPRSGASGLLQFLPSTWRTTPQGRAGLSIWDPAAQWAAGRYMVLAGRGREWSTWRLCV